MIQYIFKGPVTIINAKGSDPQIIGEALAKIEAKNGNMLKPKFVVEAAQSKRHPLHRHFEWDDAAAARAYREDQARSIIRSIRAVDEGGNETPAYVSVNDGSGTAYHSVETVKRSLNLQMAVEKAAKRDLLAWENRYEELTEVCKVVTTARKKLEAQIERAAA